MNEKRYILFDLDGTLFNTMPGIAKTLAKVLSENHVPFDPADFPKCIGPALSWSFKNVFGADDELTKELISDFRATYVPSGNILMSEPYEGMIDTLKTLHAHGKKLMIASSKPQHMCELLIEHFGLSDLFCFISGVAVGPDGVSSVPGRTTKTDSIKYALTENVITDPEHAVMIGDRGTDMSSAISLGIECIGITYGFGSEDELKSAGATLICHRPLDLLSTLL